MGAKVKTFGLLQVVVSLLLLTTTHSFASIAGTYKAVLQHEGTEYYQYATVTLRTVNTGGGELKISANVRVFFGDFDSVEYLSYEYPDVKRNPLSGQLTMREDGNDVTLVGILKTGTQEISGDWYSSMIGRVGSFKAKKGTLPEPPSGGQLVTTVSGHLRGALTNTHPEVNLPERVSVTLVTRQDTENPEGGILITGSTRLYYGEFGSFEYEQLEFESIQFNFYNRFLTARTSRWGIVYKGTLSLDGTFEGVIYADGYGRTGTINVKAIDQELFDDVAE